MPASFVDPLINGKLFSRSSASLIICGVDIGHFWKSCDYSQKLTPGVVYGSSGQPIGRTRGKAEYKFTVEVSLEVWSRFLLPAIALINPSAGFGENEYDAALAYFEPDQGVGPFTVSARGCRVQEPAHSTGDNDDGLWVKLDMPPMRLLENGYSIARDQLFAA